MKRLFLSAFALFLSLALTGCVRRIVTIDSQPQEAQVYFDRKLIGQTPYTHEFLHYGAHRLELVKEGYANLNTTLKLKGPIYEYFPLSVFSELLIPWQISDEHSFAFKLEKGQARKPVISPIEQPQPTLPSPQLERIEERQ
ncbi:MAG: PEGA domain-containing protein [Candidatus Omnitrophica bacterium]|nr:PEGA domain-containing protein [Candidatus Omnitrophota bacterium]